MAALREALGPEIDIMVDLHWKFDAAEAIRADPAARARTTSISPKRPARPRTSRGRSASPRGHRRTARARRGTAHDVRVPPARRAPGDEHRAARDRAYRRHRIHRHRPPGADVPHAGDPARLDQRRHLHGSQPAGCLGRCRTCPTTNTSTRSSTGTSGFRPPTWRARPAATRFRPASASAQSRGSRYSTTSERQPGSGQDLTLDTHEPIASVDWPLPLTVGRRFLVV